MTIDGDEAHHLARVRRIAVGETIEIFDGLGRAVRAEVRATGKARVDVEILPGDLPDRSPTRDLTLAVAVPKGDRFDWLVEKATELGVARLVPMVTARSSVDPRGAKLDRLRRLVIEACKQSGRARLMTIEPVARWEEVVDQIAPAIPARVLAHPGGSSRWDSPASADNQVILAIGPEGGFADDEVAMALGRGWETLGLGPTILRIETAAIVGAGRILLGD